MFEVKVEGGPTKGFDPPVELSLLGLDVGDHCVGYNQGTSSKSWKCVEQDTTTKNNNKHVTEYKTTTRHFTTFAVLFGVSDENQHCGWIWIACAAFAGSALLVVVMAILLHCYSRTFRGFVTGYNQDTLAQMFQKIEKMSKESEA
eukprot:TRINITY_DN1421_c0_g2_i3.p1 TRINITY_DN1421_c0_g2~~TRINITY_DN1421_c0_g2_i3.p1  ORF type:complete len:145 (-),score=30.18 TRINITY_DN1421_c0_g2_i3:35-469(-)